MEASRISSQVTTLMTFINCCDNTLTNQALERRVMRFLRIVAIGLMTLCSPASLHAQTPAEYYAQSTLTLIVGYAPGGGYDDIARLIAPKLEHAIGATIFVQNRPGGGGLNVINNTLDQSENGLTLTMVNVSAAVTAQLLSSEAARFDVAKLNWLGAVASDERVLVLPVKSNIEDLETASNLRWAAGGKTDNLALSACIISEAMGLKSKIITGYKGSSEALLALVRGEADAVVVSGETAVEAVSGLELKIAAVIGRKRFKSLPDVPTIYEYAPKADRALLDQLVQISTLGRALILPASTSTEKTTFLREKLQQVLSDPAFVAEADRKGRLIQFKSVKNLKQDVATSMLDKNPEMKARLIAITTGKYF